MIWRICFSFYLALLWTACSPKKESSQAEDAAWADIQPIIESAEASNAPPAALFSPEDQQEFARLTARLEQVEQENRSSGETLVTGESLIFDYTRHFVRMDGEVEVVDDRGTLQAEILLARFSESNRVQVIEGRRGVRIQSGDRLGGAESAVYSVETAEVQMDGSAWIAENENRLEGEHIRFWMEGARRIEAAPQAFLRVASGQADALDDFSSATSTGGVTKIYADRLVYDEGTLRAEFTGNVRLEDPRAKMACEKAVLRLKSPREVEQIDAYSNVWIHAEGREARAGHVRYRWAEGLFTLKQDPQLRQGNNLMRAQVIRFWVQGEQKMECGPEVFLEMTGTNDAPAEGVSVAQETTKVRADHMVYEEQKRQIVLSGAVRLRDPRADMDCNKVILHLKEEQKIDWIEALGEIIIQSGGRRAIADRATYYLDEGRFVLEGDPKIKQGPNILTGDRITFWQKDQRMVCEPNARALLYPDEKTRSKFAKILKD